MVPAELANQQMPWPKRHSKQNHRSTACRGEAAIRCIVQCIMLQLIWMMVTGVTTEAQHDSLDLQTHGHGHEPQVLQMHRPGKRNVQAMDPRGHNSYG